MKPDPHPARRRDGDGASRRAFLKRASALSVAGAAAPWALNLAALGEAAASTASDYKALVCVFLHGGNDYANTLVPYDAASHARYLAERPALAYARGALAATALAPAAALPQLPDGRQYALAPALAPLLPIFNAGRLATLLNVGTLLQPTSKAQYAARSVPLPPYLFSHDAQQALWQTLAPSGPASGWGGRLGDLFEAGNGRAAFTCINASGNAVYLSGRSVVPCQVSSGGALQLAGLKAPLFGSAACAAALRSLVTAPSAHLLEEEHARIARRAFDNDDALVATLAAAPALRTAFPSGNDLAAQLRLVARLIAGADAAGTRRQVFFVSMGGFDTHGSLAATHPGLLATVGAALAAFHAATVELGVAERVTAFTASDFGRTLTSNGDGSDHGWGGMHFVLGGAVAGGRHYGAPPVVANNGPDDVGQGRLLPTMAVDQLAATLGGWLGASDAALLDVLPNLRNWDAGARRLGFV